MNRYKNGFKSPERDTRRWKTGIRICLLFSALFWGIVFPGHAQMQTIKNDVFWNTVNGTPITSQGGGIFKFPDPLNGRIKYYWYGVHYTQADTYRADPSTTPSGLTFQSVSCYSSTDMVNWAAEPDILNQEELSKGGKTGWVGRLGVVYLKELKKYAVLLQHGAGVSVAVSDKPSGLFSWQRKIDMSNRIGFSGTGDQTVFTDEDTGKSYLIYSKPRGRNKIYVSEIGVKDGLVDLLNCVEIYQGESREGNCMFNYQGKYYMCASNIYGWDASLAYYLVADSIFGPYRPVNRMLVMPGSEEDYAHVTQTGFFVSVKGTHQETIVYCGDRWADFAGNGLGYNQWFPLSFDKQTPYFNSLSCWNLNAVTGEWEVGADNNYVKNGSFEADRRRIPSAAKPVQNYLRGWKTTVLEGHKISQDSTHSPQLNHFNSQSDRHYVIGEKSLQLSDKVKFKRKVSQTITSSAFMRLADGVYVLTAKVRNSAGFTRLDMFAHSGGASASLNVSGINEVWKTISLENVQVLQGKVEIGFLAEAATDAFCYIDDVVLQKKK